MNLDEEGNCYVPRGNGTFAPADWDTELGKLETSLIALGWTLADLADPYDEDFIAEKRNALRKQGVSLLTITVDPQETNVH